MLNHKVIFIHPDAPFLAGAASRIQTENREIAVATAARAHRKSPVACDFCYHAIALATRTGWFRILGG